MEAAPRREIDRLHYRISPGHLVASLEPRPPTMRFGIAVLRYCSNERRVRADKVPHQLFARRPLGAYLLSTSLIAGRATLKSVSGHLCNQFPC